METKTIRHSFRKNIQNKKLPILLEEFDPRIFMLIQRRIRQKFYNRDKNIRITAEVIANQLIGS